MSRKKITVRELLDKKLRVQATEVFAKGTRVVEKDGHLGREAVHGLGTIVGYRSNDLEYIPLVEWDDNPGKKCHIHHGFLLKVIAFDHEPLINAARKRNG